MTLVIRDSGNVSRTITSIQVRDGGNIARDIAEIRIRDSNNVSRQVFSTGSSLGASASPTLVEGYELGSGNVTTVSTTVTAFGGTPPYTYFWTVVFHSNATPPGANNASGATTTFTQPNVVTNDTAYFECTVTDNVGAEVVVGVDAFFFNFI